MTLPGKTASRFLLSAARVVLTNEQFSNDYLPDFRGDKADRVVIPQESVEKLRGFLIYNFDISFTDAVKKIFGCKEEDMNSIWATIRTSLVQKMSDKALYEYKKERSERRKKKPNQQYMRRFGCKRKRSLASLLSTASISSTFTDRSSAVDEKYNAQQTNLNQSDNFTSVAPTLCTDRFDDEYLNLPSDDENEILLNTGDELENMNMNLNSGLPDHRPPHSSTSTTVFQFSLNILEFGRISRLPDKQRIDLLDLFQKYITSPNLVPKSGDDLLETETDGKVPFDSIRVFWSF
ncbi:unnamed protein product [Rotaria socialis]|nr:unnamed protein product [Rotaria socialis]